MKNNKTVKASLTSQLFTKKYRKTNKMMFTPKVIANAGIHQALCFNTFQIRFPKMV